MPKFLGIKATTFDSISPTSTKGDIEVNNGTTNVRLGVGADGQVLTADSTQAAGLKWATAGGGASYSANVGDGTSTDIVVTHGLGTQDVSVTLRSAASPYFLAAVAWDATSTSTITLHFTTAPTAGQYRVTIQAGGTGGGGSAGADPLGTYIVQGATDAPANAQVLASLATGLLKVTTSTGVLSTATAGTDYLTASSTSTLSGKTIAAAGLGFAGSTSGTTTLAAAAAAGGTVTLPAATSVVESVLATTATSATQGTKNTTATVLGTAVGAGLALPANFFVVGRTARLKVYGTATTTATSPASLTFLCKLGTTTVATTAALTPGSAATNVGWSAEVLITCRTTGTTGTVMAQGRVELLLTFTPTVLGMPSTAAATLDTTASQALDFQVAESNATGAQSVTATNYTLEVLN